MSDRDESVKIIADLITRMLGTEIQPHQVLELLGLFTLLQSANHAALKTLWDEAQQNMHMQISLKQLQEMMEQQQIHQKEQQAKTARQYVDWWGNSGTSTSNDWITTTTSGTNWDTTANEWYKIWDNLDMLRKKK